MGFKSASPCISNCLQTFYRRVSSSTGIHCLGEILNVIPAMVFRASRCPQHLEERFNCNLKWVLFSEKSTCLEDLIRNRTGLSVILFRNIYLLYSTDVRSSIVGWSERFDVAQKLLSLLNSYTPKEVRQSCLGMSSFLTVSLWLGYTDFDYRLQLLSMLRITRPFPKSLDISLQCRTGMVPASLLVCWIRNLAVPFCLQAGALYVLICS